MNHPCEGRSQPEMATNKEQRIVPLIDAAARFGVADIDKFRKSVKGLKCLIRVADLDFIDLERFNNRLREKAQAHAEAALRPITTRHKSGSQIGILRARLAQVPKHIARKEEAIESARQVLGAAANAYERTRASKALEMLEAGLKKLRQNKVADEDALNRILNPEDSQPQPEADIIGDTHNE